VADADHSLSELTTAWLYNGDPVCPDDAPDDAGAVSCDVTFSTDGGEVTLTVRDPGGEMGTARVTLEVQPTDAPTADIASPTADGVYYSGTLITIEGTVADAEDAAEELTVLWSSELAGDLDGDFNTPDSEGKLLGAMLLDEGEHFITLTVTDSTDKEGSDSVVINVGPPNSAPTCAITAPASGSAGSEGETVMFEADVDDVDVPANWLAVAWTSDKDGPIGSSTPDSSGSVLFPYESLTVNTHVITMTVTDEMGADCTTNSVYAATVANGPPDITDVLLSPTDLYTNDTLTAEAIVADPDGDTLALTYAFSVNGTVVQDSTSDTLSGATHFNKGDNVVVVVTADDGYDIDTQASITLTVQNSPPTAPGITLERPVDALICSIDEGSTDADGDPISYAFEWDVDGTVFTGTETTTYDDDTVPSDAVGYDETWTCEVTPHDGETTGSVAETTIDIGDGSCDATGSAVLDTYEYDGMDFYPIDLDYCTPSIGGPCGLPYTAAEQMDAFCQLAGYCEATTWEVELISSTSCYCWMGSWHSSCCSGPDDRFFITEVTCG
jgi:hypothetical protein